MHRDTLIYNMTIAIAAHFSERDSATDAAKAVLSEIEANGLIIVPMIPTAVMMREGADYLPVTPGSATNKAAGNVYEAMIAASPLRQIEDTAFPGDTATATGDTPA